MNIAERYALEGQKQEFRVRALTTLASRIEERLNQITPEGEERERNLESLFSRRMRANQWFDYFCPQDYAPDFSDSETSFAMLYFTWVAGDIERFPAPFLRLWREMDPEIS